MIAFHPDVLTVFLFCINIFVAYMLVFVAIGQLVIHKYFCKFSVGCSRSLPVCKNNINENKKSHCRLRESSCSDVINGT